MKKMDECNILSIRESISFKCLYRPKNEDLYRAILMSKELDPKSIIEKYKSDSNRTIIIEYLYQGKG